MDTKVYYTYNLDDTVLEEAAKYIKNGKTVVFPTETVYGLGANALDKDACEKIFRAKGRPQDNPLIVHVANKDVSEYVNVIPKSAKVLIDKFWPGPLTIIFPKKDVIPDEITGGLKSVAIRMPEGEIARKIISLSGVPIAAPSANLSGKPSPTNIEHCIRDLSGRVNMIIGGQECRCGIESTVVEALENEVVILRPGEITPEMIKECGVKVSIDPTITKNLNNVAPKSPGMKYKHYAPDSEMTIVVGENEKVVEYINKQCDKIILSGKKVGVISTEENKHLYKGIVLSIGSRKNLKEVASKLFNVIREFDKLNVDYIFSEGFISEGVGLAIMNRLNKAAGHKIINL